MSAERPTLIEKRDAGFALLEQRARKAIVAGEDMVSVDPRVLLGAMATLDSYREMAGLGSEPRKRAPSPGG